jgi:hypothetical protein
MNSCELFGYWLLVTGYWLLVLPYAALLPLELLAALADCVHSLRSTGNYKQAQFGKSCGRNFYKKFTAHRACLVTLEALIKKDHTHVN